MLKVDEYMLKVDDLYICKEYFLSLKKKNETKLQKKERKKDNIIMNITKQTCYFLHNLLKYAELSFICKSKNDFFSMDIKKCSSNINLNQHSLFF